MSIERNSPIGVFDSGVGGLTVAREIMRNLPNENIVYFGDTARVPYGTKSKETVLRYSRQITRFLQTQNVKAIVIACNTASALALDSLEKEIDIPLIGVVRPGAETAVRTTRNKRIGVIATESTIHSGLYPEFIKNIDPDIEVFGKACPLFVPLVEEGWTKDEITLAVIERYLSEMLEKDIDTLILGCTHYPLLRGLIGGYLGENITLVNPAYETAQSLKRMLLDIGIDNRSDQVGKHRFYASDSIDRFKRFADNILPCKVEYAEQIAIEEY